MKDYILLLSVFLITFSVSAQSSLDSSFNHTGIIKDDTGRSATILVQPDGKVLTLGYIDRGSRAYIMRYLEDGTIDPSFANQGYFYDLGSLTDARYLINNKILVCGIIDSIAADFLITRLSADGTIDNSFGDGGVSVTNLAHFENGNWLYYTQDYATSLALQSDNKILVLGESGGSVGIIRYTSNGLVDSSFGQYGIATQRVGLYDNEPNDLAVLSDDRLLAGFRASINGQGAMCAMRFLPDGSIDGSFNQIGYASYSDGWLTYCNAMCLQPDGKVLLVGYSDSALIVRFDSTGALDPSFGNGGVSKLPPAAIRDMTLAPDGKILVTGTCDDDFIIYRCLSNGILDTSFGNQGAIITNVEQGEEDRPYTIALQQDGKILIGGSSEFPNDPNNSNEFVLARYLPDGYANQNKGPLQVYPNPAENILYLRWKGDQPLKAGISIYDLLGRRLMYKPNQVLSSQEHSLDISAFSSGVYFVKISGKNGLKEARKFVKK